MLQQKRLSRDKIDQLIKLQAPDEVIARHIRSESVDFPVDQKVVDEIVSEGAGELTTAALVTLIRVGSFDVHSEAGAHVLVDGKDVGAADAFGVLSLAEVQAGSHTVEVSLEGYLTESRAIRVATGEFHHEEINLMIDRTLLAHELDEAKRQLPRTEDGSLALQANEGYAAANKAREAAFLAHKVLVIDSSNPVALELVAESALVMGDLDGFSKAGLEAIRASGNVEIPLEHSDGTFHANLHDVTMTLSQEGISFHAMTTVGKCSLPSALLSYRSLSRIITQAEAYREMRLQNVNAIPAIQFGFIEPRKFVVVSSPIDYDSHGNYLKWQPFVMPGTVKAKGGLTWEVSAPQYLGAVQKLIEQLMH